MKIKTIPLKIPAPKGPPQAGQVVARRYHLNRPLGQGGMGSVWHATDLTSNRTLAVKFILHEQVESQDTRQRFDREARASQQIKSPHVVDVVAHGVDCERPYIAMELLTGITLSEKLARERRLTLPECSTIVSQIAAGLEAAHQAGVVHRDLKPGNVYMVDDPTGEGPSSAKIVDFGIAKAMDGTREGSTITDTGDVLGSPGYMSPEQIRASKHVDHRADIWSLGVIAYRMITGHRLFSGMTSGDVMVKVCGDPIPPTAMFLPYAPKELDAFFEKALARNPDRRFASARELAEALALIAAIPEPETVVDDPPPPASSNTIDIRTTRQWTGKSPPESPKGSRLVPIAMALSVTSIAIFGLWYWGYLESSDERIYAADFTQALDVDIPSVKVRSAGKRSGYTLEMKIPNSVLEEIPAGARLVVRSSCSVKGQQFATEEELARADASGESGTSDATRIRLYTDEPLKRKPSRCNLQLELLQYPIVEPFIAGVFCYRKRRTTNGGCSD